jgi:hypothetical protein
MFKGLGLSARLYLGFALVLAIMAALAAFAHSRLAIIRKDAGRIASDALPGILHSQGLEIAFEKQYALALKHILAREAGGMARLEEEMAALGKAVDRGFEEFAGDVRTPEEASRLAALREARNRFLGLREESVLRPSREGRKGEAMAGLDQDLAPAHEAFIRAVEACVDSQRRAGEESSAAIAAHVGQAVAGLGLGLAAALLAGAAVAVLLGRSIASSLNRVIGSLSEGSRQVTSASAQLEASRWPRAPASRPPPSRRPRPPWRRCPP